ncbi:hypothetical protein AB833_31110 [Chromatiales bacterium (ex Bugula neritina AB1)]|nr:hypothetical protein AB833_31110 [Chromatiales bacterium (ex Bugula neritina AB1)]
MRKAPTGRLAEVTGKDVNITPEAHYDDWADSYDTDLLQEYGYCAHRIAVNALSERLPDTNATIMDVGCGTGLVGVELAALGYTVIDGLDISARMLAEASKLSIYRQLTRVNAETDENTAQTSYDAVISVGTFGVGHMGPKGMSKVGIHAKDGGLILLFMNAEPFVDLDFQSEIDKLSADNFWTLETIEDHNYMDALDRPGKLIIASRGHYG